MTLGEQAQACGTARLGGAGFLQLGGDLHASHYTSYFLALGRKRRGYQVSAKMGPNPYVSQDLGSPFGVVSIVWPRRPHQFRADATAEPFTSPTIGLGASGDAEHNRRRFWDKAGRDTGRGPGDRLDEYRGVNPYHL